MQGGSSVLPPLQFEPGVETPVLVSWTQEQWNAIFSALMTGADLSYPEQSHQVVWDLLKFVEYPLEIAGVNMLQIDLFTVSADRLAGVGTLTYNPSASLPFGYSVSTANTTLHGMTQPVWLAAGDYAYTGWASLTTTGGNTGVAITDAGGVVATIIASVSQAGAFGTRVKHTGTFTIAASGLYNMVVGDLGTAANHTANWISHHIRQTS